MAFHDIEKVLYDGAIKLKYTDKTHRYYVQERANFDLPETDPKAWGKTIYPKGTTTLIGDTLEKKGLMTWPLGVAFQELFGYYDFIGDNGERKQGFSRDKGTMWGDDGPIHKMYPDEVLPLVESAFKAWTRKQKQGSDIGNLVHDAIEHYLAGEPYDIKEEYFAAIAVEGTPSEELVANALEEVAKAELSFAQFVKWWTHTKPKLLASEQIIYSRKYNVSGTFDMLLEIDGKRVLVDIKTSNSSKSKEAAMPEGINYQYFIQLGIYAVILEEMGEAPIDDVMIVSCRKDGGFTNLSASDLGLTTGEIWLWATFVIDAYFIMEKAKKALIDHSLLTTPF